MATTQFETRMEGRCDVCCMRDGKQGMNLIKCHTCGVCVHQTCYGLIATVEKDNNFICLPCQSVGKTIIGIRLKSNEQLSMVVKVKPTDCALCSVDDGIHAMNPIYSEHGPKGKQLILPATEEKEERLAWTHTLCAQGLCSSRSAAGCVYACDKWGRFEGDDGQVEGNPNAPVDSNEMEVHHYVICGTDGRTNEWTRAIRELRSKLKCIVCGCNDTHSTRIPIQCSAGDLDEFAEFRGKHGLIDEPCGQSLHVGCAAWKTVGNFRQMMFYPGRNGDRSVNQYVDPVSEIYCPLHAKDIGIVASGLSTTPPTDHALPPTRQAKRNLKEMRAMGHSILPGKPHPSMTANRATNQIFRRNSDPSPKSIKATRRVSDSGLLQKPVYSESERARNCTVTGRSVSLRKPSQLLKKSSTSTLKSMLAPNMGSSRARMMPPPPLDLEPIERHIGGRVVQKSTMQRSTSTSKAYDVECSESTSGPGVPRSQGILRSFSAPATLQAMIPDTKHQPRDPDKRPVEASPKRMKMSNISESKSGKDKDNLDLFSKMVCEVAELIEEAKEHKMDANFMVSERRHFWKNSSGISASVFDDAWNRILQRFENDLREDDTAVFSPNTFVHMDVDDEIAPTGENKWSHLWDANAERFNIGTWDQIGTFLKDK